MSALKHYFLTLNFFTPDPDSNEQETDQQRRWNIIGTRIYILLLILILCGITLGFSLIDETTQVTVPKPTEGQLSALLAMNAKCTCSQISIPYGKFTSLTVSFHQICSSDFITDRWIKAISLGYNTTFFFYLDFRIYGASQFQTLAGFCRLSKANIDQSIEYFYSNTLVSSEVFSKDVLQSQTKSAIKEFQTIASNTFRTQLRLINYLTVNNGLITSLGTNSFYAVFTDNQNHFSTSLTSVRYTPLDHSDCDCRVTICNRSASGICDVFRAATPFQGGNLQFYIPGISSGCLPVTSILVSSLECFYEQNCVDRLLSYFPTNEKFLALSIFDQSLYSPESTVQSIVDNLMIENWTSDIYYEKYYSECAPSSCIYFKISPYTISFIIKKLISLLASLILILGLTIPFVLRTIQQLKDRTPKPKLSLSLRLNQMKNFIQKHSIEFNLFKHYPSSNRQIRYQRYATRLYLICIISSVVTLSFYTLVIRTTQLKTISNPTESDYIQLQQDYSQSLSCPCISISMLYSHFLTIQPEYHPVCSSDLVSDRWIEYLQSTPQRLRTLESTDFKTNAPGQFKLLSVLCEQSQQIITDALRIFLQTKFFSLQVVSPQTFQVQIDSFFQDWKLTTLQTFLTTTQSYQAIIQGNRLNNNLNFAMSMGPIFGQLTMGPLTYSNCSCSRSALCYSPSAIYNYDSNLRPYPTLYSIPNFFIGCFPITSLLASTLECFYNISCMLEIDLYLNSTIPFNFSALNPNLNLTNETVGVIVNKLMVNRWLSNISFTSYYKSCAPLSCTYQYQGRPNLLIVLTTILGLFGGLSLAFKLFILIGLHLINKIMANRLDGHSLLQSMKSIFHCNSEHQIIRRLHFILIVITLIILYSFSSFTPSIITVEIDKPTLSMYEKLLEKSDDSLQCSCSRIAIQHQVFLNISSYFHEICSSDFISNQWISYLYGDIDPVYRYARNDFLYSATGQFQILAFFCRVSEETVQNALVQLGSSDFIGTELLSFEILNERIRKTLTDYQKTMPKLFINTLSLIREAIGGNALLSGLFSNWMLSLPRDINSSFLAFRTVPLKYNGCSCGVSSKCVSSSRGMLAGCYALESILQSTIQCFYNQTCIDFSNTFQAINTSLLISSRFSLNSTIEVIVNELMIEILLFNISYEAYFNTCAPLSCTYSYIMKYKIIEGITTLVYLYGGLFVICRLLSILIVKHIFHSKHKIHSIAS